MNKYTLTLIRNVRKQLEEWLNEGISIPHLDLYRFLHTLIGTSGTIGLFKEAEKSRELMKQLTEMDEKTWTRSELQDFLLPLISIFYYEEFANLEDFKERKEDWEGKKQILLMDDDPTLIMNLKDLLQENGWVVLTAGEPVKAVQAFADLQPDCVIINSQIAGGKGLDLLKELRETANQQTTPIVLIGKGLTKEDRVKGYRFGADDLIDSSLELDELIVRLNRQLERKQAIDELKQQTQLVTKEQTLPGKKLIHVGIVDDDPIIRTMLVDLIGKSKLMEGYTFDIKAFKDGMEFFDSNWYLENNEPYLIVLDGMMPRMDGIEVLQRLRELPSQEKFTIIMLTTRKSEQDITRAIQLGADDYLTKPFKLLELETRLGYLVKRMKHHG